MKNTIQESSFIVDAIKQINEMEGLVKESLELHSEKAVSEKLQKACLKRAEEAETHIERLDEALSLIKKYLDSDEGDTDDEEELRDKKGEESEKEKESNDESESTGFFQRSKEMFLKAADFVTPHGKSAFQILLTEALERINQYAHTDYVDLAIIQLCRTVESLQISIYDTLSIFLDKQKGMDKAADLLRENLDDALESDKKLAKLAKSAVPKL